MAVDHEIIDKELREAYSLLEKEQLIEALIRKHRECRAAVAIDLTTLKEYDGDIIELIETTGHKINRPPMFEPIEPSGIIFDPSTGKPY